MAMQATGITEGGRERIFLREFTRCSLGMDAQPASAQTKDMSAQEQILDGG